MCSKHLNRTKYVKKLCDKLPNNTLKLNQEIMRKT